MVRLCFLVNLFYAVCNGVLGVLNRSLWLISMCAYYTVLSTMRFSAVLCTRKGGRASSEETEYFVMRLSGALLMLLSGVLAGVNAVSLAQNIAAKHGEIIMISIAAYTFYKITISVVRAVRGRKEKAPLPAVIRSIGYADVAASVLTLQRSMLVSFEGMSAAKARWMNILAGAAVCLFIFALGAALAARGMKKGGIQNCKGE